MARKMTLQPPFLGFLGAAHCFSAYHFHSEQLLRGPGYGFLLFQKSSTRPPSYIFQAVQDIIATQARDKPQMFVCWLTGWLVVGWLLVGWLLVGWLLVAWLVV